MRIFGLTVMTSRAYEAEIAGALDLAYSVVRISEKLDYAVPPPPSAPRRHRRGGHLRLVTDSPEPELDPLWVAPRDTA